MEKLEPKKILPEDIEETVGRKNVGNEYEITKLNEQKAAETREEIKKLNENFKKVVEDIEEKKKESENLST